MSPTYFKALAFFLPCLFLFSTAIRAHNGSVAYAYPLNRIIIDGDFSDWPKDLMKYRIDRHLSEGKPKDAADFSGFFQLGYRLDTRSLYIAFTVTDNDFVEDSTENVRWNTQDGLELSIDARHLMSGSGVASFMYSKKLRNTNNAFYDPFAKNASWDRVEVAMTTKGSVRFYEWRLDLGNEMKPGKSVGLDFHVFDRNGDGRFTYSAWGKGGFKFMNPNSLGDVVLLPAGVKAGTASGQLTWDTPIKERLPSKVRLIAVQNPKIWITAEVDSAGHYSVAIPAGKYHVAFGEPYFNRGNKLYTTRQNKPVFFFCKPFERVDHTADHHRRLGSS